MKIVFLAVGCPKVFSFVTITQLFLSCIHETQNPGPPNFQRYKLLNNNFTDYLSVEES